MASRTTQESYRPRASDGAMVGNAATVTLISFGNRFGTVMIAGLPREGNQSDRLRTEKQPGIARPSMGLDAKTRAP